MSNRQSEVTARALLRHEAVLSHQNERGAPGKYTAFRAAKGLLAPRLLPPRAVARLSMRIPDTIGTGMNTASSSILIACNILIQTTKYPAPPSWFCRVCRVSESSIAESPPYMICTRSNSCFNAVYGEFLDQGAGINFVKSLRENVTHRCMRSESRRSTCGENEAPIKESSTVYASGSFINLREVECTRFPIEWQINAIRK